MIFFRSGDRALDGDRMAATLAERGFSVSRDEQHLKVRWGAGPELRVELATGPRIRQEATEIGKGTSHATTLGRCDARFEIIIENLDEVLDEINTLIEV